MSRLADLRKKVGLTQKDVAAELGVTQAQMSRYENGVDLLSILQAKKLALVLKVPLQEIIGGTTDYTNQSEFPPSASELSGEALRREEKSTQTGNKKTRMYATHDKELAESQISDSVINEIFIPEYLVHMRGLRAFLISGRENSPALRPGNKILASPYPVINAEDCIVVCMNGGANIVGYFVDKTKKEVIIKQGDLSVKLPRSRVDSILLVHQSNFRD